MNRGTNCKVGGMRNVTVSVPNKFTHWHIIIKLPVIHTVASDLSGLFPTWRFAVLGSEASTWLRSAVGSSALSKSMVKSNQLVMKQTKAKQLCCSR